MTKQEKDLILIKQQDEFAKAVTGQTLAELWESVNNPSNKEIIEFITS